MPHWRFYFNPPDYKEIPLHHLHLRHKYMIKHMLKIFCWSLTFHKNKNSFWIIQNFMKSMRGGLSVYLYYLHLVYFNPHHCLPPIFPLHCVLVPSISDLSRDYPTRPCAHGDYSTFIMREHLWWLPAICPAKGDQGTAFHATQRLYLIENNLCREIAAAVFLVETGTSSHKEKVIPCSCAVSHERSV